MAPPSLRVGEKLHAGSGWRASQRQGEQGGAVQGCCAGYHSWLLGS